MSFDELDVAGLQAKLQALDLTDGEFAALQELVARGAGDANEVAGFAARRPRKLGSLEGILSSAESADTDST